MIKKCRNNFVLIKCVFIFIFQNRQKLVYLNMLLFAKKTTKQKEKQKQKWCQTTPKYVRVG